MGKVIMFVLCSFAVTIAEHEVTLDPDLPFLSARISDKVELRCCFANPEKITSNWVRSFRHDNKAFGPSAVNIPGSNVIINPSKKHCHNLTLPSVKLNESGLYQCFLNNSKFKTFTHGTYLQVYKPLDKTINLSESTKNKILTAEGILLLLCVLLPSATLLFKSKKVNQLEKKKVMKEEENIYQGLNLDDCCTTYDQIERSQAHGQYQDVCNIIEEEEEIQLEKP